MSRLKKKKKIKIKTKQTAIKGLKSNPYCCRTSSEQQWHKIRNKSKLQLKP
ncbi:hypothetical protein Fmac_024117 [Flemingia macrophylla]|uniref:Ribosomal protein L32 n=1 Tax=Flemingia macrophylla TaxID=520843 RepID=A0ABD1LNH9_9FABA